MKEPAQIAALLHDHRGIPVTWASAWTSELTVEIRRDPLLAGIMGDPAWAYFSGGEQGVGKPRIALPHTERVRQAAIMGLCQVCGNPVGPGPRWVCDIRLGEDWFRIGKRMVPLLIDSWTCNACIEYSLRECPNLSRREYLNVLIVREWLLVPSLERPKWIDDSVPYGPVGFVKIAALRYDTLPISPVALAQQDGV